MTIGVPRLVATTAISALLATFVTVALIAGTLVTVTFWAGMVTFVTVTF